MAERFQGKIPVSMAKQVFGGLKAGQMDVVKEAVVSEGLPIIKDEEEPQDNSTILFGEFPEAFAVKGLLHDAAVNMYAREADFSILGAEPSSDQIMELLEGGINGTASATPELRHRVNELETQYDLKPDELLAYSFGDRDVHDRLREVAEYRSQNWQEDTAEFDIINPELPVSGQGMSGRIDLSFSEPVQIRELKMKEEPSEGDEFQLSAYWLMSDGKPEAVLEYPLIDEILEFNPESDTNDFDPREYAFDVYSSRDQAIEMINELRGLQNEYFASYDSREEATRDALRDLQV